MPDPQSVPKRYSDKLPPKVRRPIRRSRSAPSGHASGGRSTGVWRTAGRGGAQGARVCAELRRVAAGRARLEIYLGLERLQSENISDPARDSLAGEASSAIQVPAPKEAIDLLEARSADTVAATVKPGGPVDTTALQQAAFALREGYLTDTLRIDAVATDGARESARAEGGAR